MIPGFDPIFPVTLKIFKEQNEKISFNTAILNLNGV